MRSTELGRLFKECMTRRYRNTEIGVSWDAERRGDALHVYFEPSNGTLDWLHNLTFHAAPYTDMDPPWQCHAGFLKCWKSVRLYLEDQILDSSVGRVLTVGYSHGAALALLCHEYIYYNRPDLRGSMVGVGFGCPRVLYGCVPDEIARRWEHFYVVRNGNDIVTHLPPRVLGYCHVGSLITVGKDCRESAVDAHRPESYRRSL